MKKFLKYLHNFYTEHFKWGEFIVALLFVAGFVYLRWETKWIDTQWRKFYPDQNILFHFLLYSTPILLGYFFSSLFHKDWSFWKNPKFYILIIFAIGIFAVRSNLHFYIRDFMVEYNAYKHADWLKSLISSALRGLIIIIPMAIYWWFVDRKNQPLYGFTLKNFDTKPYFGLLLLMVPLVILASTQGDFLGAYPRGAKIVSLDLANQAHWKYFGIYEFFYGMEFISIEFFFRGFLILAFVGVVGPKAIIPMAYVYAVIHWNKPAGELISSFFGGTILGIISYYGKSIIGGIIVHMGLAWLMEIGALVGKHFNQ